MKRSAIRPELRGRHLIVIGVTALGIVAGGALIVIALGRPDANPAATLSPTAVSASVSPSATRTPEPSPSPSAAATDLPTTTVEPTPSASLDEGWNPTEIAGIHAVTGIVERNGRVFVTGQDEASVGALVISDDGETWLPVDLPSVETASFYSVVPGEAGFITVATHYPILMGMPEHEFLFSPDGRTWSTADPPADCVSAGIVAHGSGFIGIGDRCRTEGDFAPGTLQVLASFDGRTWTSRADETMRPGPWATDGRRIVLLQELGDLDAVSINAWISDDAARSWRPATAPFPDGFHPSGLLYGHGLYVAPASWRTGEGDPQSAVCISTDGDGWRCEVMGHLDGQLDGRNWLARQIAVTSTGFATLVEYVNDPFFGGDGSTDMILGTSRDGLSWHFTVVPELKDRLPSGIAWTSRGLFSWGGLNRDVTPDAWVPYLVVRDAALP